MLFLVATVALAACQSDAVSRVKEGVFPADKTYTWSQALDSRKSCSKSTWSSTKDEAGRTWVEYRCLLEGAAGAFEQKRQRASDKVNDMHAVLLKKIDDNMEQIRARPAYYEERLAHGLVELEKAQARAQSAAAHEEANVEKLKQEKALLLEARTFEQLIPLLESKRLSQSAQEPFLPIYIERYHVAKSKNDRAALDRLTATFSNSLKDAVRRLDTEISWMERSVQQRKRAREREGLAETEDLQNALRRTQMDQEGLDKATTQLDASLAAEEQNKEKLEAERQAQLSDIERRYAKIKSASEVVKWIVLSNGELQLSYFGLEIERHSGVEQREHSFAAATYSMLNITKYRDAKYAEVALEGL